MKPNAIALRHVPDGPAVGRRVHERNYRGQPFGHLAMQREREFRVESQAVWMRDGAVPDYIEGKYIGDIGGLPRDRCSKTVIIPAFNEETRIAPTLERYLSYFDSDTEIMVVLNECSDGTANIALSFLECHENLRVIDVPGVRGKGLAVRLGFYRARGDVISYIDADGSLDAPELDRLVGLIGDHDGVVGSRWIDRSFVEKRQTLYRETASRVFNLLVRLMFRMPYTDTQCAAKVFKREAVEAVVDDLRITNYAFDVDLLYLMSKKGFDIQEVPTLWEDKPGSKIKVGRAAPMMLAALVRMRIKHSRFNNLVK